MAVLTLALAAGARATVYAVASGVLLEPLPFRDADRLVRLRAHTRQHTRVMQWLLFQTSRRAPLVFAAFAVFLQLVGGAASFLPARRGTPVDPRVVLQDTV